MYYLLSLAGPPLVLALLSRFTYSGKGILMVAMVSAICTYLITVGSAFAVSEWYEYQHNKFDLNGDGFITGSESSPEQGAAMIALTSDTGRTMTVFFGAPWALLVSSLFYLVVAAIRIGFSQKADAGSSEARNMKDPSTRVLGDA